MGLDPKFEQMWKDPANWTSIGFYRCADDPRWWVPKREPWMGWTLNMAHRGAWLSLVAILVISIVPTMLLLADGGGRSPTRFALAVGIPVALSIGLLIWLARRDS